MLSDKKTRWLIQTRLEQPRTKRVAVDERDMGSPVSR